MSNPVQYCFDLLVNRINSHPEAKFLMLTVVIEARKEYEGLMIHGREQDRHVACNLRRFLTTDVASEAIRYSDQVARDGYRRELADLKECDGWDHIGPYIALAQTLTMDEARKQREPVQWAAPGDPDVTAQVLADCSPNS